MKLTLIIAALLILAGCCGSDWGCTVGHQCGVDIPDCPPTQNATP